MGSTVPVRRPAGQDRWPRLWTPIPPHRSCGRRWPISRGGQRAREALVEKGDGPGRGDNRGRRRAKLRGGGAGAPVRSTPRGSEQINGGPSILQPQLPTAMSPEIFAGHERCHRDGTPRTGCHRPWTRPGDQACICVVVAAGQARHDRSTSGLPARGCPWDSRWSSDSRTSTCLMSTPGRRQSEPLTLGHRRRQVLAASSRWPAQPRRPARTASQTSTPARAAATRASAQCPSQSATPSGRPVPYAASAPR